LERDGSGLGTGALCTKAAAPSGARLRKARRFFIEEEYEDDDEDDFLRSLPDVTLHGLLVEMFDSDRIVLRFDSVEVVHKHHFVLCFIVLSSSF
jgi:hypothetical protein